MDFFSMLEYNPGVSLLPLSSLFSFPSFSISELEISETRGSVVSSWLRAQVNEENRRITTPTKIDQGHAREADTHATSFPPSHDRQPAGHSSKPWRAGARQ